MASTSRPLRFSENDVVQLEKVLTAAGYEVVLLCDGAGQKQAELAPTRANCSYSLWGSKSLPGL